MYLKNRTTDIKDLMINMMQDFVKLDALKYTSEDEWRKKVVTSISNGAVDNWKRASYSDAAKIVKQNGANNYSAENMDVTVISALYRDNYLSTSRKVKQYLNCLHDERNFEGHTKGHETFSDRMIWAYGVIKDLYALLKAIGDIDIKYIPEKRQDQYRIERERYLKKYEDELGKLVEMLEQDVKDTIKDENIVDYDIERIFTRNSKNIYYLENNYLEISSEYCSMPKIKLRQLFFRKASEHGLQLAYEDYAKTCFNPVLDSGEINYDDAAKYYELVYDKLHTQDKLNLASIYRNNLCNKRFRDIKQREQEILEEIKAQKWIVDGKQIPIEIVDYTSKDGYLFYKLKNNFVSNEYRPSQDSN